MVTDIGQTTLIKKSIPLENEPIRLQNGNAKLVNITLQGNSQRKRSRNQPNGSDFRACYLKTYILILTEDTGQLSSRLKCGELTANNNYRVRHTPGRAYSIGYATSG